MPRRGKGGRFVSTGHKSSTKRRRSSSAPRAIVRSTVTKPVIIRQTAAAPARRHHPKRHRGGHGGGGKMPLKTKGEIAMWASGIGYVKEKKASTFNQIPTAGKIPREAVIGAVAHYFGGKNKHADRLSVAALTIAGYELGRSGFEFSGWEDD